MKRLSRFLSNPAAVMNALSVLLFVAALVVLLVGCGNQPVVRSEVPVAVKCVTELPEKPVYRTKGLKPDATEAEKVKALALDWLDSRPYEAKLEAGLAACM